MSIATCPYCGQTYDQDFEVEHEEMCEARDDIQMFVGKIRKEHGGKVKLVDVKYARGKE